MPKIEIRQAEPADYEKIAEMHCPVWLESYGVSKSPYEIESQVLIVSHISYPKKVGQGDTILFAESDGEPVGMIIFGPDRKNDPNDLHIGGLYIKQEVQRGGIGSALLEEALASQPSGDVTLSCAEMNHKARAFYEKRGFVRDGKDFTADPGRLGIEALELGYVLHRSNAPVGP